ncbi:MAG: hypothetical protein KM310_05580 [Clostridiales bacterium]|nr:hypothetical protein [Clostridiales bacterium]
MATAYTPGLLVSEHTTIRKVRRLPIQGEVLAEVGQAVAPQDVVARALLPGKPHTLNVANKLALLPEDVPSHLLVKEGEPVEEGQVLAATKGFFGLGKKELRSPVSGTLEMVSRVTGQVTIREKPVPVELTAYLRGKVVEVLPKEGVVVETSGAFIQGIFGVGGERVGRLQVAVSSPEEPLEEGHIGARHQGAVVVGGSLVTLGALRKAAEVGAQAVVAGSIWDTDLAEFIGYEIGVAITGQEDIPLTLIITEGFGPMAMAQRTFRLLQSLEGREAAVNGATQVRAGVLRPEVVVPREGEGWAAAGELPTSLQVGSPVRLIREPYFGLLGVVTELPPDLKTIETEAKVRVAKVRLQNGEEVLVPRANMELLAGD